MTYYCIFIIDQSASVMYRCKINIINTYKYSVELKALKTY